MLNEFDQMASLKAILDLKKEPKFLVEKTTQKLLDEILKNALLIGQETNEELIQFIDFVYSLNKLDVADKTSLVKHIKDFFCLNLYPANVIGEELEKFINRWMILFLSSTPSSSEMEIPKEVKSAMTTIISTERQKVLDDLEGKQKINNLGRGVYLPCFKNWTPNNKMDFNSVASCGTCSCPETNPERTWGECAWGRNNPHYANYLRWQQLLVDIRKELRSYISSDFDVLGVVLNVIVKIVDEYVISLDQIDSDES